jgi:hypothetical protein
MHDNRSDMRLSIVADEMRLHPRKQLHLKLWLSDHQIDGIDVE